MNLKNKKILIIYQPWGWGKYENTLVYPMINELKSTGANVELLDISNPPFFTKNTLINKLKNLYSRNIKNNLFFYQLAEVNHYSKFYLKKFKLLKVKKFDYILIIGPDIHSKKFLLYLKNYSEKIIGYMWDGLSEVQANQLSLTRNLFNNIFVFNKSDLKKYPNLKLEFDTNFYYHYQPNSKKNIQDLIYIGGIYNNRKDLISYNFSKKITENFEIIIFVDEGSLKKNEMINDQKIIYVNQHIPYLKTLEEVYKAKCLLDICRNDHKGLSFRFFEALFLEKKIITNNKDVKNYNFYNPNNIMVIEDFENFNIDKVKIFLTKPYEKIDKNIVESYSFKNWFLRVFNLPENEN